MNHNDILRRLRYALSLDDQATLNLFKLADHEMDPEYLSAMMKHEQEKGFLPCRDKTLSLFLDGLIYSKRGKQGEPEPLTKQLSNNEILRKIRIAMKYRDEDIIALLQQAEFRISKGELSALFRKPDHRNYKECGDQLLRNLIKGMTLRYRAAKKGSGKNVAKPQDTQKPKRPTNKEFSKAERATEKGPRKPQKPVRKPQPKPESKPSAKPDTTPSESVWGKVSVNKK